MITGICQHEFHALVKEMWYNPLAFLTDDRRENAGRVAIDRDENQPVGLSPQDPDYEAEDALRQKVFPGVKHIPWVKDWRMSRTHGVVYAVKDYEGRDVIMFPVHGDVNNPIVSIAERLP